MLQSVSIEGYTSFPGIRWRLRDPTTELTLAIVGSPELGTLGRYAAWFTRRYEGCFRLFEGSFPGDWLVNPEADALAVHLAAGIAALQRLAMQPVRRAQVLEAGPQLLRLALPSYNGTVLQAAVRLAIQLLLELDADPSGQGNRMLQLESELEAFLGNAPVNSRSGANQLYVALAADRLGIPIVCTATGFLELGHGIGRALVSNSLLNTVANAAALASDKMAAYLVLHRAGIPVPKTQVVNREEDLGSASEAIGWPLVVKPLDGSLKLGVTKNVKDSVGLRLAYHVAANVSTSSILVQQQVAGREFRITTIGPTYVVAREVVPAFVVGDGHSTVLQLVAIANLDPLRGNHSGSLSCKINLDSDAEKLLEEQSLALTSIPVKGLRVWLSRLPGRRLGGSVIAATSQLHPSYFDLARRAAGILKLEVMGMDLITPDPSRPWWEVGAKVLECNCRPGLYQHEVAEPNVHIFDELLSWGLASFRSAHLIVLAGGENLNFWRLEARKSLSQFLCGYSQIGELWEGHCILNDQPLITAHTESGQSGQALLADPRCGAALMAWQWKDLERYGRPCESIDLALLTEGADQQLLEEILDADPQVVLWLGPGLHTASRLIERWRSRSSEHRLEELQDPEQLSSILPELLSACTHSRRLGHAVRVSAP